MKNIDLVHSAVVRGAAPVSGFQLWKYPEGLLQQIAGFYPQSILEIAFT